MSKVHIDNIKLKMIVALCTVAVFIMLYFMTAKNEFSHADSKVTLDDGAAFQYETLPERFKRLKFNNGETITTREIDGAYVFSASENATLTFNASLSAQKLVKDFNFIEFVVIPSFIQEPEDAPPVSNLTAINVTLTEVANPENYVIISLVIRNDVNYVTSGRAGAVGQSVMGQMTHDGSFNERFGTQLRNSFSGSFKGDANAGAFSFDFSEKAAYGFPSHNGTKVRIRDLDMDDHMIGSDIPWKGFNTDEIKVSLTLEGVSGTAKIAILSFNGATFTSSELNDISAPQVYSVNVPDGLAGEVNKPFPVFEFKAYDDYDGLTQVDDLKVFYSYKTASQREFEITNGHFIPDLAGTYTIVASKTDSAGNTGICEAELEVYTALRPIEVILQNEIPSVIYVGSKVSLPEALVTGGTSGKGYTIKVLKNETEIEINEGFFTATEQGIYTVRYSAYDFRRIDNDYEWYVRAVLSEAPIAEFPSMPSYIPVGVKLQIPTFTAIDWFSYGGEPCDAVVSMMVTDSTGTFEVTDAYTPIEEGDFVVTLKAKALLGESYTQKTYTIKAIKAEKIEEYFFLDGVKTSYLTEKSIIFEYQNENGLVSFINALPVNNFKFRFKIPSGYDNFTSLDLILVDSRNPEEQVTINCRPNGKYSGYITMCGEEISVRSSFDYSMPFSISLKNGNMLYNLNLPVRTISRYDSGKSFRGFGSEYVYLTVRFNGVTGSAAIQPEELCNHTNFLMNEYDNSAPTINIKSTIVSHVKIGDVIGIPEVEAYDVFEGKCDVILNVFKENKRVSLTKDGKSFVITEYGVYTLRITSSDSKGNNVTISHNIYCENMAPPVIELLGEMPETGAVGKEIKLPSAKAYDYNKKDLEVKVFVFKSGGTNVKVADNTFVPTQKGIYTVYYYTYDANFNPCILKFTIVV